jgi:ribonuclease VapC
MMVADTSAIMAILMDEPEGEPFGNAMVNDGEVFVSTATAVELMLVAMGKGDALYQAAVQFLGRPFVRLISPDEAQMWVAANAFRRYGKGRHPAGLNFGDTFSYALAATRSLPLLFKGEDFPHTDISPAGLAQA